MSSKLNKTTEPGDLQRRINEAVEAALGEQKRPYVYISGPMTGLPDHNFPAFNAAAADLDERFPDWDVSNPAQNPEGLSNGEYIAADVASVCGAVAVWVLPGWANSAGARLEFAAARYAGVQVWEYPDGGAVADTVETEAQMLVRNGARQQVYGHPRTDFERTGGMWSAYLGVPVTAHDVAMMMVLLKVSRLRATPNHRDSRVDGIGYLICDDRLEEK